MHQNCSDSPKLHGYTKAAQIHQLQSCTGLPKLHGFTKIIQSSCPDSPKLHRFIKVAKIIPSCLVFQNYPKLHWQIQDKWQNLCHRLLPVFICGRGHKIHDQGCVGLQKPSHLKFVLAIVCKRNCTAHTQDNWQSLFCVHLGVGGHRSFVCSTSTRFAYLSSFV